MNNQRRTVLKSGSGAALLGMLAAAGLITPGMALADWNKAAFDAKSMADTLKALGAGQPADSKDVQVTGPDIAENGAVVPVGVAGVGCRHVRGHRGQARRQRPGERGRAPAARCGLRGGELRGEFGKGAPGRKRLVGHMENLLAG